MSASVPRTTGAGTPAPGSIDAGIPTEPEMGARTGPCTLLIVEDEARTRARLAQVIAAQPHFLLAGAAATLAEARTAIAAQVPEVLLLDLGLPDGSGIELIVETRRLARPPEVLVISVMGDEGSVLAAIQAGAGGYLLKDSEDAAVVAAIEQLLQGGAPLSPSIAVHLMRRLQAPADPAARAAPELSARETELLRLIAKGLSYEEVAQLTGLRYNTIASYAKELYRKLQVRGRAEAAFEAVQLGLVGGARESG
ncbi:MAG: response regulator transcription factor [Rhodanobacteraceae bacterium]|nr:response regulator transcription factor [Rhodanobacteraceae bacterium]